MGSFVQGKNKTNNPTPPAVGLRIQNSAQGAVRPLLCGLCRIAGNLIFYGGFNAEAIQQSGSGGGGKGGGSSSNSGNVSYNYSAYVAIGICAGPTNELHAIFDSGGASDTPADGYPEATYFNGSYSQGPWGYLATNFPDESLNFRGLAYVAFEPMPLGSNPSLPNLTFDVRGGVNGLAFGYDDADPRDWIQYLLTDEHEGIGFPSEFLSTMQTYSNYCRSLLLLISQAITSQQAAATILGDIAKATNSDFRWSSGILDMIPLGTAAIGTYVPNTTPVFDIVDDDYLANQGASGSSAEPVSIVRLDPSLVINDVQLEYLDRNTNYNPVSIDAKDEAGILTYGKVPSGSRSFHQFAFAAAASMSAALQLNREQIISTFTITVGPWAILADVLDLLTLTRAPLNMLRKGVRINEIQENQDLSITFICEEFLGTADAPAYGREATAGYQRDLNEAPGPINPPLIFEPTAELLGGAKLEIWCAVSGEVPATWGGYNVYASFDGGMNFSLVGAPQRGPARMGVLTAPLATVAVNPTGTTIDEINTLAVDLSESASALLPGTQADVLALATACYLGGEVIAYRDATLTSPFNYDLDYMVRGGYGTENEIALHPTGTQFARLDQGIFRVPFDQSMIGQTIYLKFQSFNPFGGGLQSLADLAAYPYVIQGVALTSPLEIVQNVRTQYTDGFEYIYWDDVQDFRTGIRYKIFKGSTFVGAQQVGDNAHAPFIAFGGGTYWIVAYCQPVPALYVYSETPASITIAGNMLIKNLVYTSDQKAEGWTGTFSNGVGRDGGNIRLGGAGDFLSLTDVLNTPDILNFGGIVSSGTYEIPSTDYIDVHYTADCYVNATWIGTGAPASQNVLAMTDFLNQPDILGAASTQFVNITVQIATAVGDVGDLYGLGDLYTDSDLYAAGIAWSDWKDYVPGVYRARWIKFRLVLTTIDPATTALAEAFSFQVSVPARIDHYPGLNVTTGGLTITFEPDDASVASPFNGGPPVGGVANQPLPFINFSWSGNADATPVIDSLTLSAVTFHFVNSGGTQVEVDGVNVTAEGY